MRAYDNAHGRPEMHRYSRTGEKQPAEAVPGSSVSDAFNVALEAICTRYLTMIDQWKRA